MPAERYDRPRKHGCWVVALVTLVVCGFFVAWALRKPDDEVIQDEVAQLVAQREELDRTIWSQEVLAQQHEALIVKLWDDLRARDNHFSVFAEFPFETLVLGNPQTRQARDWGITLTQYGPPTRSLQRDQYLELLNELEKNFRIVQTEWHHSRFETMPDGTHRSEVSMTLHVLKESQDQRFIVKGNLHVQWSKEREGNEGPLPRLIEATNVRVLEQTAKPAFREILKAGSHDPGKGWFLACYDLNGDGLSEIIRGDNVVFRNLGQGQFATDTLSPYLSGNVMTTGVFADFTGDGHADLLCASKQTLLWLFPGDEQGEFFGEPVAVDATDVLEWPWSTTAGDVDGDGDLDVWVGQYKFAYRDGQMPTPYYDANDGHPSYLLLNDGRGNFVDVTETAGLAAKRHRRTYSSSLVDLDDDGDLDLVVVSDFAGVDAHYNDGQGHFTDVTEKAIPQRHTFGMSHTFSDYNLDGKLDFYVIGMSSTTARRLTDMNLGRDEFADHQKMRPAMGYGNRLYLADQQGGFTLASYNDEVARTGWSWGSSSFDFDNDGDRDIYVANGHVSGESAQDYCTQFWRHDIYSGTSQPDPALDRLFRDLLMPTLTQRATSWNGYEHNCLFLNDAGRGFMEVAFLMDAAYEFDSRAVISDDLDADGRMDLLVAEFGRLEPVLHVIKNDFDSAGNWIGVRLREEGGGFSPIGVKITLSTAAGRQVASVVTGDSFEAQHAPTIHFGLGAATSVQSIEVRWPNGAVKRIEAPAINRYHLVRGRAPGAGS